MRGPRRVRRFLALPAADQRRLAWAWLTLAAIDARLRALGFRRLVRHIERSRDFHAVTAAEIARARRAARWLDLASRHHVVGAQCLHRSLALHAALRRRGLESVLRIGVRMEDGALRAHAWVELAGEVINDTDASTRDFTRLVSSGFFSRTSTAHHPALTTKR